MQNMEVLSGREYGNEFESEGGSVVKSRFTIYAGVAFLLLIVLIAPHRDDPGTDSNFKLPKHSNATGGTAGTEKDTTIAPISEESSMESWAQSPLVAEPETSIRSSTSRPEFATICDLPPSVQRDSHNFTILNRTDFCLSEVSYALESFSKNCHGQPKSSMKANHTYCFCCTANIRRKMQLLESNGTSHSFVQS